MHLVVEGWARADSLQVRDQAEWESDGLLEAVAVSARHDLAVEANLVPAACNPTIVGGSTIDYGRISAAELEDAAETTLPGNRSFDLSVSCDAATQFAVRATDNRAGSRSAMDGVSFGLGTAAGGERIGYFRLNVQTAGSAIDALPPSKALLSMDGGLTWVHEDNIGLRNDGTGWVGLSKSVGETTPSMATHAVFHIAIDTKIAPRETLPTTGEINLDGNVTLEVFTL
ncbi:DUF1120 domain-containing protein [Lysobacter sp. GCM10012299]|uniref:DUF1120 domain-containing protein n=1 Tax=Lysobacter sp. GCM10012299 TaxID=3317333 RepID=UPI003611642D